MNGLQKVAGVAAVVQAALFLTYFELFFAVLSGQGIAQPDDLANPAKALPAAAASPVLAITYLVDVPFSAGVILVALALYERLRAGSSSALFVATAAGFGAAVLIVTYAMIGFLALPDLARLYSQNPVEAGAAYRGLYGVLGGWQAAITFVYGWWALLASWLALRTGALPRLLNYVGLAFGAAGIVAFALPPLALVGPLVGIVWLTWLGIVLLSAAPTLQQEPHRAA